MAELIDVFKSLVGKGDWSRISDDDKIKNFFIINRYMAKKYPDKAQLFNSKIIDKVVALNIWHYFIINEPYPNWFWSKSDKSEKPEISEGDIKLLQFNLKVSRKDIDYLIINHIDFIKEELKHFKKIEKQNK